MGDRAIVVFKSDKTHEISPIVYLHWNGCDIWNYLNGAVSRMPIGDLPYATARFIGYCHNNIEGCLSLGVQESSLDGDYSERIAQLKKESPGDAGVFLVDVDTGVVKVFGGYGFETEEKERIIPIEKWAK